MITGIVARADNSGLGNMSWELWGRLGIDKAVVITNGVYQTFPERFGCKEALPASEFDDAAVRRLLEGLDAIITVETPYNWNLYKIAKEMGVKSVMFPMYECLKKGMPRPDLYICPSDLDFDSIEGSKVSMPFPVNTEKIRFKTREYARTFVHNAGHGGLLGRNGTDIVLAAIPLVKNKDARFIIRSQTPTECDDPRVDVRVGNFENYWDMWDEGDVFVFPHKFDGLSLPIQEALAAGMPLITTRMYPFDTWLPTEFMVDVDRTETVKLSREITASFVAPDVLAHRIDAWAGREISTLSKMAGMIANERSWKALKWEYDRLLFKLCGKKR